MIRGRRTSILHAVTAVAGAAALLLSSPATGTAFGGVPVTDPPIAAPAAPATAQAVSAMTVSSSSYGAVPGVVRFSGAYAIKVLKQSGYQVWVGKPRYDSRVGKYRVVAQVLRPGYTLRKGRTVTIYPSLGPKPAYKWASAKASTYGGARENQHVAGPYPSTRTLERRGVLYFAHKHMRFGTKVLFSYRGRSAFAICVDRGPYVRGREFDLGVNTARALRFGGVGRVSYAIVR